MPYTTRFGLTTFSNSSEGTLTEDGGKFTGRDRQLIDRVLSAFETHAHVGGSRLADPAFTPTLAQTPTGGTLAAGTTYYYRVSLVDPYGLETAASGEVAITTPDAIEVLDPPILTGVAPPGVNQLPIGLHTYGFTAKVGTSESVLSPINVITVETGREAVEVRLQAGGFPVGADEVHIWRMGPTDAVFTRVGFITSEVAFVDDGTVPSNSYPCDPFLLPPTENQTNAQSSVTITVDAAAVANDLVSGWRIYRTENSGVYAADSLVAHVVDTVTEGSNDLVSTYTDTGVLPLAGQPLEASQTLQPSGRLALPTGAALPDPVWAEGSLFLLDDGTLHAVQGGRWRAIGGGGGAFTSQAEAVVRQWMVESAAVGEIEPIVGWGGDGFFVNQNSVAVNSGWTIVRAAPMRDGYASISLPAPGTLALVTTPVPYDGANYDYNVQRSASDGSVMWTTTIFTDASYLSFGYSPVVMAGPMREGTVTVVYRSVGDGPTRFAVLSVDTGAILADTHVAALDATTLTGTTAGFAQLDADTYVMVGGNFVAKLTVTNNVWAVDATAAAPYATPGGWTLRANTAKTAVFMASSRRYLARFNMADMARPWQLDFASELNAVAVTPDDAYLHVGHNTLLRRYTVDGASDEVAWPNVTMPARIWDIKVYDGKLYVLGSNYLSERSLADGTELRQLTVPFTVIQGHSIDFQGGAGYIFHHQAGREGSGGQVLRVNLDTFTTTQIIAADASTMTLRSDALQGDPELQVDVNATNAGTSLTLHVDEGTPDLIAYHVLDAGVWQPITPEVPYAIASTNTVRVRATPVGAGPATATLYWLAGHLEAA